MARVGHAVLPVVRASEKRFEGGSLAPGYSGHLAKLYDNAALHRLDKLPVAGGEVDGIGVPRGIWNKSLRERALAATLRADQHGGFVQLERPEPARAGSAQGSSTGPPRSQGRGRNPT